jgi:hypothetical protein
MQMPQNVFVVCVRQTDGTIEPVSTCKNYNLAKTMADSLGDMASVWEYSVYGVQDNTAPVKFREFL